MSLLFAFLSNLEDNLPIASYIYIYIYIYVCVCVCVCVCVTGKKVLHEVNFIYEKAIQMVKHVILIFSVDSFSYIYI